MAKPYTWLCREFWSYCYLSEFRTGRKFFSPFTWLCMLALFSHFMNCMVLARQFFTAPARAKSRRLPDDQDLHDRAESPSLKEDLAADLCMHWPLLLLLFGFFSAFLPGSIQSFKTPRSLVLTLSVPYI